jgi:hypothetical protein
VRLLLVLLCLASVGTTAQQSAALPVPGFHHLHLNSTDPDAAIAFYVRQFTTTSRVSLLGLPALKTGRVHILFSKVRRPADQPQSAYWHFGWHVPNVSDY